jgi:hypothetical protein
MDMHSHHALLVRVCLAATAAALIACGNAADRDQASVAGASGSGAASGAASGASGSGAASGAASGASGSGAASGAGGATAGVDGCSASNLDACEYPSRNLSFSVREGFSVTDPITGRQLPLLARVPAAKGPLPVVIYSHGGGFNAQGQRNSVEWSETMAAHGYAVIHIAHIAPDAVSGKALCELGSVPPAECVVGEGDEDANGMVALVKTRDVIAVLDALTQLSEGSVAAGGPAIDLGRVAVAGWSAGSRAPLVTLGAVFMPSPSTPPLSMAHPLPKAAVAFSPIGPGYAGFFDTGKSNTWQDVRGAVLMATGDNDIKPTKPDLTGADRRIAFEKQASDGHRWLLYSHLPPGVGEHSTYNLRDLASSDQRLSRYSRAMRSAVLAFLDAELRGDTAGAQWLAGNNAAVLGDDVDWVHK